jgi:hypothetical protein
VLNNRILLYFCAYVWIGYMPEHIQAGTYFIYLCIHIYLFIVLHITDFLSASG